MFIFFMCKVFLFFSPIEDCEGNTPKKISIKEGRSKIPLGNSIARISLRGSSKSYILPSGNTIFFSLRLRLLLTILVKTITVIGMNIWSLSHKLTCNFCSANYSTMSSVKPIET